MTIQFMKSPGRRGFSQVDLIVSIAVVALLAAWLGLNNGEERVRIARCARNLHVLGETMNSFANDHTDGLPAAGIDFGRTALPWDVALFPYLHRDSSGTNDDAAQSRTLEAVAQRFFCPSDSAARAVHPRTYAMAARDMTTPWPPTAYDRTGVGVAWDESSVSLLLGGDIDQTALQQTGTLPRLKRSVLPAPADTLLLTELITPDNKVASLADVQVRSVRHQRSKLYGDFKNYHLGRFNYLMVDGHVEWLTGLQTGGIEDTPGGIWTINPRD